MFGPLEMLICLSPLLLVGAVAAMVLVVRFQKH